MTAPDHDPVNHPSHYTAHPSGIECIQITEHMDFCLGNAMKYLWRAGQKDGHPTVQELRKAIWYIARKIAQIISEPLAPETKLEPYMSVETAQQIVASSAPMSGEVFDRAKEVLRTSQRPQKA